MEHILAMVPKRLLVMVGIFTLLFILPIRIQPRALIKLAGGLWLTGGIMLFILGVSRLMDPSVPHETWVLVTAGLLSAIIGFIKGKFILGKTSQRNIERIQAMTEPQRPMQVYSQRSWIIVSFMILLSASLTWFGAPDFWRGIVNLAVGMALVASSLNYFRANQFMKANGFAL